MSENSNGCQDNTDDAFVKLYEDKLREKAVVAVYGECLLWTGSRCSLGLVGNYGVIYVKCKQLPDGGFA